MSTSNIRNPPSTRSRWFSGVIYPDSDPAQGGYDCDSVITAIKSYGARYALSVHDKDVEDDGTPKKTHFHFLLYRNNAATVSQVARALGVPSGVVRTVHDSDAAYAYLTHDGSPDKYQYDRSAIVVDTIGGTLTTEDSAAQEFLDICDYIDTAQPRTMRALLTWSAQTGHFATIRRDFAMYNTILRETAQVQILELQDKVIDYELKRMKRPWAEKHADLVSKLLELGFTVVD